MKRDREIKEQQQKSPQESFFNLSGFFQFFYNLFFAKLAIFFQREIFWQKILIEIFLSKVRLQSVLINFNRIIYFCKILWQSLFAASGRLASSLARQGSMTLALPQFKGRLVSAEGGTEVGQRWEDVWLHGALTA